MWNSCIKIYEDGEFKETIEVTMEMVYSLQKYITLIGHDPKLQVWFDTESGVCFGPEQHFYIKPDDFSFFSLKESFHANPRWGLDHIVNYFGSTFGPEVLKSQEYILQKTEFWNKYKDKTILIVGAGPSTRDVEWKNTECDYVWTCNNFFLNEDFSTIPVDLAAIGPSVDIRDEKFINYVKQNSTTCVLEGGISPFRTSEDMDFLKDLTGDNLYFYHLRYFSKVGTIARMICLATLLEAKEIIFVGMDGSLGKSGDAHLHAFEGASKTHDGRVFSDDRHRRQYVLFWDYLLNDLQSKTKYQNLGEDHPANQSSNISKQMFPLKERVV